MKNVVLTFLLIIIVSGGVAAQTSVNAADVFAQINRGQAVTYQNVEITGDLDLTQLANKQLKKGGNKDDDNPSTKEYVSTVTAPLKFTNCTFTGKVLAYYNPDQGILYFSKDDSKNEIYNTNFEKEVSFQHCTFQQDAAFKYSQFKEAVSFTGSTFADEAFFKYAKFEQAPDFSKVKFSDNAVFKYVHFPANTNFSQAVFTDDADFKYAKFPGKVNFEKAQFNGFANFKYADFSDEAKLQGLAFNGNKDFKYTKLGGQKFTDTYRQEK
ncbi:pentapeptide repeat-containing protein [Adhaeribacter swui]|uniref:Pentapeptide repeat-containing protein n=1 Tax=Adhaeribacter swui TaxID=2086471 RepID=A0A7G7G6R2_9BACT|nr:pentapeptide repeat-containing protein [Adhaeribacter swui]QNF32846.1 pentapeptide repeat-containing protein [Adhaeribacter swui]